MPQARTVPPPCRRRALRPPLEGTRYTRRCPRGGAFRGQPPTEPVGRLRARRSSFHVDVEARELSAPENRTRVASPPDRPESPLSAFATKATLRRLTGSTPSPRRRRQSHHRPKSRVRRLRTAPRAMTRAC